MKFPNLVSSTMTCNRQKQKRKTCIASEKIKRQGVLLGMLLNNIQSFNVMLFFKFNYFQLTLAT